jgi:hypothetical protein
MTTSMRIHILPMCFPTSRTRITTRFTQCTSPNVIFLCNLVRSPNVLHPMYSTVNYVIHPMSFIILFLCNLVRSPNVLHPMYSMVNYVIHPMSFIILFLGNLVRSPNVLHPMYSMVNYAIHPMSFVILFFVPFVAKPFQPCFLTDCIFSSFEFLDGRRQFLVEHP